LRQALCDPGRAERRHEPGMALRSVRGDVGLRRDRTRWAARLEAPTIGAARQISPPPIASDSRIRGISCSVDLSTTIASRS
jgi:hypothetical protein